MLMERDLVIGLDCSTSGCKSIVWDKQGNAIAEGRCGLEIIQPRLAWHEQSADAWWSATNEALCQAVSQINPNRLVAMAISHQRETFVPVNEQGRSLRNAIIWMDERAGPMLSKLSERIDPEHFHQITGKPLSGNLTFGKIAWLKENEPGIISETSKFLDVQAYLVYRLIGEYKTSWGSADPMGLFDMNSNQWSSEIMSCLEVTIEKFPSAFPPGEILGTITKQASDFCHLPQDLLVVAGLGDGQAAGLGINITHPGEAYLSLGTGVVSGSYSDKYVTSKAFRTMYGGGPNSYVLETVLLGGVYTVNWFVENFSGLNTKQLDLNLNVQEILDLAAQKVSPGSQGLILVPYWNSAMNPYWESSASGIVVGWRGIHKRQHLYRAILEGIAYEQRLHMEGVEESLARRLDRYIAAGGGARNDLWCQIIADITGKPIFRTRTREASSLGAAILAATGAGLYSNVNEACQAMTQLEPDPFYPIEAHQAFYDRIYSDVYVNLFPSLQKYLNRLSELADQDIYDSTFSN